MYGAFANIYDEAMGEYDYDEVMRFLEEKICTLGSVLEMACGTGNLTALLEEKYNVKAFDISEDMLKVAANKLRDKSILSKQDMRDFKYDEKFQNIICFCDSLNYILKDDEVKKIFANVYNALDDRGKFIFDLNTIYNFKNYFGDSVFYEDKDDYFYLWENFYDEDSNLNYYNLVIFEKNGDLFKKSYEEHIERGYEIADIKSWLMEAGFKNVEIFDGYTDEKIKDETLRGVFVCYK